MNVLIDTINEKLIILSLLNVHFLVSISLHTNTNSTECTHGQIHIVYSEIYLQANKHSTECAYGPTNNLRNKQNITKSILFVMNQC